MPARGRAVPQTPHLEKHFTASATIRDIVIGMADGLTVPFALAAGLSGAIDSSRVVITAGLAEIAAGSIAMGLGGYLAARTDAEHYAAELAREKRETIEIPEEETREVVELFDDPGLHLERETRARVGRDDEHRRVRDRCWWSTRRLGHGADDHRVDRDCPVVGIGAVPCAARRDRQQSRGRECSQSYPSPAGSPRGNVRCRRR